MFALTIIKTLLQFAYGSHSTHPNFSFGNAPTLIYIHVYISTSKMHTSGLSPHIRWLIATIALADRRIPPEAPQPFAATQAKFMASHANDVLASYISHVFHT
jgi:hypothetical protein